MEPTPAQRIFIQWLLTCYEYLVEYVNKVLNILLDYLINHLKQNGKGLTSAIIHIMTQGGRNTPLLVTVFPEAKKSVQHTLTIQYSNSKSINKWIPIISLVTDEN